MDYIFVIFTPFTTCILFRRWSWLCFK